jgi:hypothetical protein
MFDDIVDLEMWLQEQRGETTPSKRIRMRTAVLDDAYNEGLERYLTTCVIDEPEGGYVAITK